MRKTTELPAVAAAFLRCSAVVGHGAAARPGKWAVPVHGLQLLVLLGLRRQKTRANQARLGRAQRLALKSAVILAPGALQLALLLDLLLAAAWKMGWPSGRVNSAQLQ